VRLDHHKAPTLCEGQRPGSHSHTIVSPTKTPRTGTRIARDSTYLEVLLDAAVQLAHAFIMQLGNTVKRLWPHRNNAQGIKQQYSKNYTKVCCVDERLGMDHLQLSFVAPEVAIGRGTRSLHGY